MDVLIQNCLNWTYLGEGERWSTEVAQAKRFNNAVEAMDFARNALFRNIQIVLKFERGDPAAQLPI